MALAKFMNALPIYMYVYECVYECSVSVCISLSGTM